MKQQTFSVAAVIVTYNRIEKLKIALKSYEEQILLPKYLIIVNNYSNDGTKEYLENWVQDKKIYKKIVINTNKNIGGSGGFYIGQKKAIELDVDWVYLADDDAYPEKNYFKCINDYLVDKNIENIAVVCGKVNEFNNYCNSHRRVWTSKWLLPFSKDINEDRNLKDALDVKFDFISYVGVCINSNILKKAGLVEKKYFIYYDDTEHSIRLRKFGNFICLLNCEILHDKEQNENISLWKIYYDYRNCVNLVKKHLKLQAFWLIFLMFLKALLCPIKGRSFAEQKMRLIAVKDGIFGRLGKHSIYKPGWKA